MKTPPTSARLDRALASFLSDQRKSRSQRLDRSLERQEGLERALLKKSEIAQRLETISNGLQLAGALKSTYDAGSPFGEVQKAPPNTAAPPRKLSEAQKLKKEEEHFTAALKKETQKGLPKLFRGLGEAIRRELKLDRKAAAESQQIDQTLQKSEDKRASDAQQRLRKRIQYHQTKESFV